MAVEGYQIRQWKLSPSLLSPYLILEAIPVRPLSRPTYSVDQLLPVAAILLLIWTVCYLNVANSSSLMKFDPLPAWLVVDMDTVYYFPALL